MTIIIALSFLISLTLFITSFKWLGRNGIFLVLPINLLADVFIIFTSGSELHSGLLRVPILVAIILANIGKIKSTKLNAWFIIYLIFTFSLCFLSSNLSASLNVFIKFGMSILFFPIAVECFKTEKDVRKLWYSNTVVVILVLLNFYLAQIFGFGDRTYSEEATFLPGGGVYLAYILSYVILGYPLFQLFKNTKSFTRNTSILYLIGVLTVLLIFRRAAILAVLLGFGSMVFFAPLKLKQQVIKYGFYAIILVLVTFPIYGDVILKLYDQRIVHGMTRELEAKRGRKAEAEVVFSELFSKSVKHTLIGSEFLNSREVFSNWSSTGRNIHNDFISLLHGTGVVGLLFYLGLIYGLVKRFRQNIRPIRNQQRGKTIRAVFNGTMIAFVLLSVSSQLYVITVYSFFWMLMGFYISLPKILAKEAEKAKPEIASAQALA